MQYLRIDAVASKKLLGMFIETTLAEDKTRDLWSQFMPRVKEIINRVNRDLYSIHEFEGCLIMDEFTPITKFKKWAAVEVEDFKYTPNGLERLTLSGGLYAVFVHKGLASTFHYTGQYIYNQWLPNSKYELDHRPHFEIMGEHYLGPDDPNSIEEVFVPVKTKSEA
jgi:AraC family transcriptional regulator